MREGDWGSFKGAMQVRLMLLACWECFYSGCGGRGGRGISRNFCDELACFGR